MTAEEARLLVKTEGSKKRLEIIHKLIKNEAAEGRLSVKISKNGVTQEHVDELCLQGYVVSGFENNKVFIISWE